MKLIEPSFEIWEQSDVYKQIEKVGRVCYKSEDKITETSAKPFVDRMIKSQHLAMLEHGTVYLKIPYNIIHRMMNPGLCQKYINNPYSEVVDYYEFNDIPAIHSVDFIKVSNDFTPYVAITTNMRVIIENGWEEDLKYLCEPTKYHEKRVTVHFVCNRQVSHEFVRHRVFSFAQESTRYCNYTKDKFDSELTFIKPCWEWKLTDEERTTHPEYSLNDHLIKVEEQYFNLIERGWKPQQAATILPNALKTELVMTGFIKDWLHFFDLRALGTTGAPHPQAKELAEPLMNEFINRGYINNSKSTV